MATIAARGQAKIAKNAADTGNVAHGLVGNDGLGIVPDVFSCGMAGDVLGVGPLTWTVDATNIKIAAAAPPAVADCFVDWFVMNTTLAAETSKFAVKAAAQPSTGISTPTGFAPTRFLVLANQVATPAPGLVITLNAATIGAYMAAHLTDSPLEFEIDNPNVRGAFDSLTAPTTLTLIANTTANQTCNVKLRMLHSLIR